MPRLLSALLIFSCGALLLGLVFPSFIVHGESSNHLGLSAIAAAPTLTSPPDGFRLGDFTTTLQWTNPSETTQVQLKVTPAHDDGPGINLILDATDAFTVPPPPQWYGLLPDMTYTWKVRASDALEAVDESSTQWGVWSPEMTFRTPVVSTDSLSLTEPALRLRVTSPRPYFRWADANSRVYYYELQVSKDATFNLDPATATAPVYWLLIHGGVTVPLNSYRLPEDVVLEPETAYYWRARPRVQGDGAPISWSAVTPFFFWKPQLYPDLPSPQLDGGTIDLQALTIPAGTTVQTNEATTLLVNGPVTLDGTLQTNGKDLTILAQGDVVLSGSITTGPAGARGPNGGAITVQSAGAVAVSGSVQASAGATTTRVAESLRLDGTVRRLSSTASPAGNGGGIRIEAGAALSITSGAKLSTGTGATGTPASVSAVSVQESVEVAGGKGGDGGSILLKGASLTLPESGLVFELGKGGDGGAATYKSVKDSGGFASGGMVIGGAGGDGGRLVVQPSVSKNQIAALVSGGDGGKGGAALGAPDPTAAPLITAAIRLYDAAAAGQTNNAQGGNGGAGRHGGDGGSAAAAGGGNGVNGGNGGNVRAIGGNGGDSTGSTFLSSTAGKGGDARAGNGGDGGPTGEQLRGGHGGDSVAIGGKAGTGETDAGAISPGGNATAGNGGKGGDSTMCPSGIGGTGGVSLAIGGNGFPGGNATAGKGGDGGKGASCCDPPPGRFGGQGGDGGLSSARGGHGFDVTGGPGGNGGNGIVNGTANGGRGGDGKPPGNGGAGGRQIAEGGFGGKGTPPGRNGLDIPASSSGVLGASGQLCPLPTSTPTPTPPSTTGNPTDTPTPTQTASPTPTMTPTASPSPTSTPTPTGTPPTATVTATRTSTPANRPPVIRTVSVAFNVEAHVTYYDVSAIDPDLDQLTWTWTLTSTCGSLTLPANNAGGNGYFHGGCSGTQEGGAVIKLTVSDGKGGTASYSQAARANEGSTVVVTP